MNPWLMAGLCLLAVLASAGAILLAVAYSVNRAAIEIRGEEEVDHE